MCCESCGQPFARYEGEDYCPDCTRYEAIRAGEQTDALALILLDAGDLEPADRGDHGPPF